MGILKKSGPKMVWILPWQSAWQNAWICGVVVTQECPRPHAGLPSWLRCGRSGQQGHIAQSMLFSILLPRASPYDLVSLLSLAQGAPRALQWKCAFPFLVAGGALWRTQRHLEQTRMGPLFRTRTTENVHFSKVL